MEINFQLRHFQVCIQTPAGEKIPAGQRSAKSSRKFENQLEIVTSHLEFMKSRSVLPKPPGKRNWVLQLGLARMFKVVVDQTFSVVQSVHFFLTVDNPLGRGCSKRHQHENHDCFHLPASLRQWRIQKVSSSGGGGLRYAFYLLTVGT